MAFQILVRYDAYPHIIHVFLFVDESTLLRNWNHSNRIIQTQVLTFSCQLVGLPIFTEGQFAIIIFQCLVSIFDNGSLYAFKFKVLRVLCTSDLNLFIELKRLWAKEEIIGIVV